MCKWWTKLSLVQCWSARCAEAIGMVQNLHAESLHLYMYDHVDEKRIKSLAVILSYGDTMAYPSEMLAAQNWLVGFSLKLKQNCWKVAPVLCVVSSVDEAAVSETLTFYRLRFAADLSGRLSDMIERKTYHREASKLKAWLLTSTQFSKSDLSFTCQVT